MNTIMTFQREVVVAVSKFPLHYLAYFQEDLSNIVKIGCSMKYKLQNVDLIQPLNLSNEALREEVLP